MNRKDPTKETPWEPSTEQDGAARGQTWHKAVQEKEEGRWLDREEHFVSVSQEQKRAL